MPLILDAGALSSVILFIVIPSFPCPYMSLSPGLTNHTRESAASTVHSNSSATTIRRRTYRGRRAYT